MKTSSVVHLLLLFLVSVILQSIWDYNLETLIVVLIFYEVGGDVPAFDQAIKYNERFVKFLSKLFDRKKKRKYKHRKVTHATESTPTAP